MSRSHDELLTPIQFVPFKAIVRKISLTLYSLLAMVATCIKQTSATHPSLLQIHHQIEQKEQHSGFQRGPPP